MKDFENNTKARVAIVSCLSDEVFGRVVRLETTKEIWDKLRSVYEGDLKSKKVKLTNLKRKFENLKMSNDVLIKGYIHKFAIEESHDLDKYTLDQLVNSLFAFENVEMDGIKKERREVALNISKKPKDKPEASEEMDELEAKFVRRLKRGTKIYKDEDDDERKDRYKSSYRNKKIDDRDKGKRGICSMEPHLSRDEDDDDSNEGFSFLDIKEKDEGRPERPKNIKNGGNLVKIKVALHAKVEPKSWIIDSICSNHMTCDKGKFINLENYDGGSVKFAREEATPTCEKGSIIIDGKRKIDDVYYVKGLRDNLLSVSQTCAVKVMWSYLKSLNV
ncbi:uncharacterized protein LOC131874458 [Cryptomeria japonica]|uniref:uncharacterized protein LOC131874458 n=1 Tax=Cryptomeria japonica TaxID=3369 RepID=UPI0027DA9B26|nr:uncharacterized protein LOC131874458 [Cryptomeria japonica]